MKKRTKKNRPGARIWQRGIRFLVLLLVGVMAASIFLTLMLRWIDPPASAFMLRHAVETTRRTGKPTFPDYRWVDWKNISPYAAVAVVASEDQKFPVHHGFDFDSISSAMQKRINGGPLRGASTISQQTAKNLFLWPGRSMWRKGLEAWMTVWLELFCPKRRILEIYLNIAEFGRGVYGVEAAAETFFHCRASRLTPWQSALLASVLPSPKKSSPVNPSWYVQRRAAWTLQQMYHLGGSAYLKGLDHK